LPRHRLTNHPQFSQAKVGGVYRGGGIYPVREGKGRKEGRKEGRVSAAKDWK
jgi:hypothetical protein